jgi:hypothetical protein
MTGLAAFGPLSPAEIAMIDGLGNGTLDRLGAGGLPEAGDETRRVRADLIRFVLLGGDAAPRLHEKGLRLSGAWIVGTLDLEGCRVPRDIGLLDCRFDVRPVLLSAIIDTLAFDGSDLPGLLANRLDARGDLLFRAATIRDTVELRGARVGGDLVFDGASLDGPADGGAVFGLRMAVRGGVLFRGAAVRRSIILRGGRIGGDLDLTGARIAGAEGTAVEANSVQVDGDVTLRRAEITGTVAMLTARVAGDVDLTGATVSAPDAVAVDLGRTTVAGAFFLTDGAKVTGTLSLDGASLGAIVDDPASWPAPGDLRLNRCLYGAFLNSVTDAPERLDWLARQSPERWGEDFWPQPYEQLAFVLGEMGHDEDKRRVLVQKELLSRRARRRRAGPMARPLLYVTHLIMGVTTGFGRLPLLALVWIFVLWASGTVLYSWLESVSAMRPNSVVVLRSPEWVLCGTTQDSLAVLPSLAQERPGLALPGESQLTCYLRQPEAAAYPKFNAAMLSVDASVPGSASGQSAYWSPDTRTTAGYLGKWFWYFQGIAGIALGLLAVAGFTGIVKSN